MPTNDERRAVAARLREPFDVLPQGGYYHASHTLFSMGLYTSSEVALRLGVRRLADLIEPEERTCHMVFDHLTDTAFCDVCGERFDGVAQYMAMVPNDFSLADYKAKYKDANFCPNCGAKVVRG